MLAEGGQAVKPSASGEASRYATEGKNSRPLLSAIPAPHLAIPAKQALRGNGGGGARNAHIAAPGRLPLH